MQRSVSTTQDSSLNVFHIKNTKKKKKTIKQKKNKKAKILRIN